MSQGVDGGGCGFGALAAVILVVAMAVGLGVDIVRWFSAPSGSEFVFRHTSFGIGAGVCLVVVMHFVARAIANSDPPNRDL